MDDLFFLNKALKLAKKAASQGEIPVGAVIVNNSNGEILGEGYNMCEQLHSPVRHAEMIVIEAAAERLGSWRLANTTLYVTLEPCAMCTGAIINARIDRVVFGAFDKRAGACGSAIDLFKETSTHTPQLQGGVSEDECKAVLSEFFKSKREKPSKKYELWDLFDKDRHPIGTTHSSVNPLPEGRYHLKVLVLVRNAKNELLLVKPTGLNDIWSGIGGTVVADENSLNGACRKLMENGIRRKKEELKFLKTVCSHNTFVDCYELKTVVSSDEIELHKAESEEFKWVELDKLCEFSLSDELSGVVEELG